ncbi:alpha/beta hydrolase [Gracilimonas sp. BCB1]|uniref:alpha/beta hydrolase n=1 Tax=Gracilimonas sp. BCB1 TaxID=3152362 RepID=UPI0032D9576E
MKKILLPLLPLIFLITTIATAQDISEDVKRIAQQEYPTDTLFELWLEYQKDEETLARFYNSLSERHIIEPNAKNSDEVIVTYFAKGSEDTEYFMQSGGPDFYGLRFRKIGDSSYYYCTQSIPNDAWFSYGINEFKRKKLSGETDTYRTSMEHVHDGAIIGPEAPLSPYVKEGTGFSKGELLEKRLFSKFMGEERRLVVYLPSGYTKALKNNLVIQLDGQNYLGDENNVEIWKGWTPMPTILDNLIARNEIETTVSVFVLNQGNRSKDMLSDEFADFLALEVITWARENFYITDSAKVVISGPSRAGYTAARTALKHPDLIDGVLSQSGSYYYTLNENENWPIYPEFEGKLLTDYRLAQEHSVRFYLDVGLYDLGLGRVGMNRQFRDILMLKGYDVHYNQYKGGHSHLNWRHTLSDGLIYLLAK